MFCNVCDICRKKMGNSIHKVNINGVYHYVHVKCEREIGCSNCVSLILRRALIQEGECICGRYIINLPDKKYRIIKKLEVKSGDDANDDGIPPKDKSLGILPKIL